MNNSAYNSSICIILNQFKNEHITEDEAVHLIEDLYRYKNYYIPYWPQITYKTSPYEIICKQ